MELACLPPYNTYPFCDTSLSIPDRVADLLSRMSLQQKAAQMDNTAPGIPELGIPKYEWYGPG